MQLNELKELWMESDKKIDQQIKLSSLVLKKINLGHAGSALKSFGKVPLWGCVISLLALFLMAIFIYFHYSMLEFVLPAVLIGLFAVFQMLFSGYQYSMLSKVNYGDPVLSVQKTLGRLKVNRIRYLIVTRFSYALLWLPVLMVGLKAVAGYNLYSYVDPVALMSIILTGLACFAFGVWFSFRVKNREVLSPWLGKLLDNVYRNDVVAKDLYSAMSFINDIEVFETELA